ncbi:MAG: hypothetical protein U0229_11840 [Anaeromyxobacter sp.]
MRRAILLLPALAALAACSVELEGAACDTPGNTDQCPAGQKCGWDKKCSVRAADPDCLFCELDDTSCGGAENVLLTCTRVDAACRTLSPTTCDTNLVCRTNASGATCGSKSCTLVGEKDGCPGNQRCGYDKLCSDRAGLASCKFCTIGTTSCVDGGTLRTCLADDTICHKEVETSCGAKVCSTQGGPAACVCAPPGATAGLDPERSGGNGATATGAQQPPECRAATLAAALATGASTVKAYKQSTGPLTVQLSETLALPSGFTLTTDDADASQFVLRAASGFPVASDVVRMVPGANGATLEHFTIATDADLTSDGVEVDCTAAAATAKATLNGVQILGGSAKKLGRGLVVTGGCYAEATDLVVSGAKNEGAYVKTDGAGTTALVQGEISGNGKSGVAVEAGKVTVQGTAGKLLSIHGNGQFGVLLTSDAASPKAVDVTLQYLDVHDNTESGVKLDTVKRSNAANVEDLHSQIYKNKASTTLADRRVPIDRLVDSRS